MLSSPRTASSSGLKRRREAYDIAERRPKIGTLVPGEPSREAQVGWGDDFPVNFKVLSKIGEGSFGTVWTARRGKGREGGNANGEGGGAGRGDAGEEGVEGEAGGGETEVLLALKRINPTCSPSRILNEFEQMRKLGGRNNVIRVQGIVRTPGGAFALVMPFFEHDDFRQTMKTITLSGVAVYMRALLTALAHVHAEEIIHRDIKPRNFMYNSRKAKGLLIDFGLAEPAEKWKCRSEALATHRTRRARRKQSRSETPLGVNSKNGNPTLRGTTTSRNVTNRSGHESRSTAVEGRASDDRTREKEEKEERSKLLRKVERGGTTGFRAPEILWHCRDQEPAVDVWSAGVILLCLLSRRYPLFPSADSDEMALVQIAALLGSGDIVRAARKSGRCNITEFPPQRGGSLERLCAPLLGGEATRGGEEKARADALGLVRGMLKVDPKERLSAKDALMHPFVEEA